jgi:subtilisin family serine protease
MIDENMLVVAAIGNDEAGRFRYPAALPEVLAVGAVDEDGEEIKQFSGSVPAGTADLAGPDLVGIGENVLGANACNVWGDSLYARWAGTSQATAYVSGIAGLYWSMNPRLSAADIRNLLIGTAKPVPPRQSSDRWGAGLARFDPPKELLKEHEGS